MAGLYAALDIGGTKTAAALVDDGGQVLARTRAATPAAEGPDAILATAAGLVRGLVREVAGEVSGEVAGDASVEALGVGSAGVIDPVSGFVLGATDTLAGWAGTDLRGALEAELGWPVAVANDVHTHALGEATYGAGVGRTSLLYVAVGTGIGGAYVHAALPGRVLWGAHAAAGHVGHVPSPHAEALACTCGSTGHLEALASGPGLAQAYERRTGRPVADLREVVQRAEAGEADASAVIALGGTAVGEAVGGMVNVFDPDVVVIGGGVSGIGEGWWGPLREASVAHLLPSLRGVPIVASSLGDDAALLGAAALAQQGRD